MKLIKFASITKKIALAAFGLFLLLFLPVHLGINLCLLREDGGEWYRNASHFMGTNYIVKVFEIVLLASVLFHIVIAILLTIENLLARPIRYKVATKTKTPFMSRYMIWTGGVIACFLVIHFINFYFVKFDLVEGKYSADMEQVDKHFQEKAVKLQSGELSETEQASLMAQYQAISQVSMDKMDKNRKNLVNLSKDEVKLYCGEDFKHYEPDFYNMSLELFANKTYSIIYLLVFVILGFHLFHAIGSLAQTLGLNHKKYTPIIDVVALAYAVLIPLGFAVIPLWLMFMIK
ncbi:MAG TPA: succinate dehydrogenase cytochrome b subunit [Bacteroidales bacterium]|nr:succinate dehydrogenase cytochrome b subunit [Bacteroidales bacterium]